MSRDQNSMVDLKKDAKGNAPIRIISVRKVKTLSQEVKHKQLYMPFKNSSVSFEARLAILQDSVIDAKKKINYFRNSKRAFSRKYKLCNM